MLPDEDAEGFAARVAEVFGRVATDIAEEDAVHENPISGQLTGRVKESLREFKTPNIVWSVDGAGPDHGRAGLRARQLTSQGRSGSEEKPLGADIIFCLDIQTSTYSVQKGFLAQAKVLPYQQLLETDVAIALREQCKKMLSVTPASMVFLYSANGIHVVPATAVAASTSRDIYRLPTYDVRILFYDFAICWFGDPIITSTDKASLEKLKTLAGAREALLFKGRSI